MFERVPLKITQNHSYSSFEITLNSKFVPGYRAILCLGQSNKMDMQVLNNLEKRKKIFQKNLY